MRRAAALLVGLSLAALLAGCASTLVGSTGARAGQPIGTDTRSAAEAADDERIGRTIRERYSADPELAQAALETTVASGVVTVRGTVSGFAHRDRAVRLAGDVRGVVRVQNQIRVDSR